MFEMSISYDRLWKLLIDKKMSQAGLRRATKMSTSTMAKLRKEEVVALEVLKRICIVLDCNIGDVMDFIKTEKEVEIG
jgi:DNA-binding Xre family transcriptional regulator